MFKTIFFSFTFLCLLPLQAQNDFKVQLDSIQDESQASEFIAANKAYKGTLFVFNKEKHKSQLAKELFSIGKGGTKTIANEAVRTHYKIIEKYEIPYYRYSYVYIDGTKKTASEAQQLQHSIIAKYNEGFQFRDLAKRYSMDANANRGGDLGWFTQDLTATELQLAIIGSARGVGEIFTLQIPEKNAYYVVLKSHPDKMIEEIKVLQVTETIN